MRKILILSGLAMQFLLCSASNPNSASLTEDYKVIFPSSIKAGDKIAVLSPASAVDHHKVDSLVAALISWGYEPVELPSARGRHGSYSAPDSVRAAHLMEAFANPEIKAIFCTRGGHGSIHLLPWIDMNVIKNNPKWLIGFSDITVLHAVMNKAGVASIHGPMSDIHRGVGEECVSAQKHILERGLPVTYTFQPQPYNQNGTATGRLYGGNLITFNELAESPYDFFSPGFDSGDGMILFIEEIEENVYAVERLMTRLHMAGKLQRVNGLIFGQFTDCAGDADFSDTEQMLRQRLAEWGYLDKASKMPIVFKIPFGHEWPNYPLVEGAKATITVTPDKVTLTMTE